MKVISHIIKMLVAQFSLTVLLLGFSVFAYSEMVIIVNPSNNSILDQASIKNIFLGKNKRFPNGEIAIPVEIESGELRKTFIAEVLKKNEGALNSHWARMIFTGKGMPPKAYKTSEKLKKIVANDVNSIGFIDSSLVDKTVKVIDLK